MLAETLVATCSDPGKGLIRYRLTLVNTLSIRVASVANESCRFWPFCLVMRTCLSMRSKLGRGIILSLA